MRATATACCCLLAAFTFAPVDGRKRPTSNRKPRKNVVEDLEHGNDVVYKPADFDPVQAAKDVDPAGIIDHIVKNVPHARCAQGGAGRREGEKGEGRRGSQLISSGIAPTPTAQPAHHQLPAGPNCLHAGLMLACLAAARHLPARRPP
eukprot:SAG22_NODE_417_length_10770_cov_21.649049_11_plen_147_part_01